MQIFDTLSGALTTDVLIIAAVFGALFFFAAKRGKSRSIALMLSIYVAILSFLSFPFLDELTLLKSSEVQVTLSHIAVFALGTFLAYLIIKRSVYAEYPGGAAQKFLQAGILAAGSTALLFAFAYHTLPVATLYDFNQSIDNLFSSAYFFYWLVAPLGGLYLVTRH
ncbi:MAG: hypothetical protein OQJ98_02130 [Candidatus Pacebacteria bacterium]|nr:hypothetical protein [Candidatus Paceibacterota bacterium]